MKNVVRIISLLFLAAFLHGCAAVKVAYDQAPGLAYWYLDDYLEFNAQQRPAVNGALVKVQQWHRQTQLPLYIENLQTLQQQMPQNLTAGQACALYASARSHMVNLSGEMERVALDVVPALEAGQLQKMQVKFEKSHLNYRKDYIDISPQKLHAKRMKWALKRAELLYGKLDNTQLNVLDRHMDDSSFNASVVYAERLRRSQDLRQTLQTVLTNRLPADKAGVPVHAFMERLFNSPDPAFRQHEATLRQETCRMSADVHNSTTPAQRSKAVQTLKGYEQDLRALNQRA